MKKINVLKTRLSCCRLPSYLMTRNRIKLPSAFSDFLSCSVYRDAPAQTWNQTSATDPDAGRIRRVQEVTVRHHLSRGKILMKRIMLMKVKDTRMSISHSSQFTDFLVCCSRRSDSVFSFSKFMSA